MPNDKDKKEKESKDAPLPGPIVPPLTEEQIASEKSYSQLEEEKEESGEG